MKYIVCEQPGLFTMKEKEVPSFGKDEVLIRIKKIGICGSDLHAYRGNQAFFEYPRIFGHELGGQVLDRGSNADSIRAGDKVAVLPYLNCGSCLACRAGKTNCCVQLKVLGVHTDGGMQEKIAVPSRLVITVNDLGYEDIALIEPLAIGAHALRRAEIRKGEFIVVMGCGPIGLGIMRQAQLMGGRVIAMDVIDRRLDLAIQKFGVEYGVRADKNPREKITGITNGEMATAVFDATGNKQALENGPDYMAHGGRYIIVGLYNGKLTFHQPSIQAKETSLLISRNATREDFHNVIEMLRSGNFPSDSYITNTVNFDQMIDHFDHWLDRESGVIKAMVTV